MIIKLDAGQLEWRAKVFLAQDKIAMEELCDPKRDIHSENQVAFGLPTRTIAKNFLFRMIFADAFGPQGFEGPGYAFSKDPNFSHVSTSPKFWAKVAEKFFDKYQGVYSHSVGLIRTATEKGLIVSPSGREYEYTTYTNYRGEVEWPRTQILNHIVQGFSADLMVLIRRIIFREWPYIGEPHLSLLINTVHDDVEADVVNDPKYVEAACVGMLQSFQKLPDVAEQWFNVKLNIPFTGEVKFGMNLMEDQMSKYNPETFLEDFKKYAK